MKLKIGSRSNPKLFDLLRMGCQITLPDGRYLKYEEGDYIQIGTLDSGSLGIYCLTREGLTAALGDQDFRTVLS